ncbi:MAG: 4'-phosphopantetheinyl transferase superfamily protein [Chthoniobacterales bacterium]
MDKTAKRESSVALWSVFLDRNPEELRRLTAFLDEVEARRAANFHFELDRNRWIVARATLRILLGKATQSSPDKILISTTTEGKPYLVNPMASISFNLSHSRDHALIALADGAPVGVDIECYDRGNELETCIPEFCHPEECKHLSECVSADERNLLLIRMWCAKESYLKAIGAGFAISPLELLIKWRPDGNAVISRNGVPDTAFLIHFPKALLINDFCIAVSLSPDVACPSVKKLDI